MRYEIVQAGESRSFPRGDPFLAGAAPSGEVVLYIGGATYVPDPSRRAILVELGNEGLGVHTGECSGDEGFNTLGFARYRNGDDPPSRLIELVVQPNSEPAAIEAGRSLFEGAGFEVALCADRAGRIVDALIRPVYNAALRFLDEGLAGAADMDATCRLGLGYPEGPIERVIRGGLDHHYDVTSTLFEVYGTAAYAPARRAVVARQRRDREP
jgi:3-hydroxybutyryl-CoA dehydrogenase